jgi:hypothetical protein
MYQQLLHIVSQLLQAQRLLLTYGLAAVPSGAKEASELPAESSRVLLIAHQVIRSESQNLKDLLRSNLLDAFIEKHESAYGSAVTMIEQDGGVMCMTFDEELVSLTVPIVNDLNVLLASLVEHLREKSIIPGHIFPVASLLALFSSSSHYIYNWLAQAPNTGEEAVTDWLFYNLARHSTRVKFEKFTKHEEGRVTGADVELWFVDNESGICLRIQAKKLTESRDNYSKIAYTTPRGLQIEQLISDAKRSNAIPFYALYYPQSESTVTECVGKLEIEKRQGVHLACAHALYGAYINTPRKSASPEDILFFSHPIACVLCSSGACELPPPFLEAVFANISDYYGQHCFAEEAGAKKPGWHDHLPEHVKRLLRPDFFDAPVRIDQEGAPRGAPNVRYLVVVELPTPGEKEPGSITNPRVA